MDFRQRLLAVLDGRRPDAMPWFADLTYWFHAQRVQNAVPEEYEGDAGFIKLHADHNVGYYLGYAIAHYADFYELKHVLILGRVTSGRGGPLILEGANEVLQTEFPELAARVNIQLPDEKSRRVGQSIAAASLPGIG